MFSRKKTPESAAIMLPPPEEDNYDSSDKQPAYLDSLPEPPVEELPPMPGPPQNQTVKPFQPQKSSEDYSQILSHLKSHREELIINRQTLVNYRLYIESLEQRIQNLEATLYRTIDKLRQV
jgi:hypothetical protein